MINLEAILTFGGLALMLAAYIIAIVEPWKRFRRIGNYVFWAGVTAVLVSYFSLHQGR